MHAETIGNRMMSSTFASSKQSAFPKSPRFKLPNVLKAQPAPNSYSPKADILGHVKSNHIRVATTKFGMDTSSILDSRWGKKAAETTPGPGSYGRWSDFTKDIK